MIEGNFAEWVSLELQKKKCCILEAIYNCESIIKYKFVAIFHGNCYGNNDSDAQKLRKPIVT